MSDFAFGWLGFRSRQLASFIWQLVLYECFRMWRIKTTCFVHLSKKAGEKIPVVFYCTINWTSHRLWLTLYKRRRRGRKRKHRGGFKLLYIFNIWIVPLTSTMPSYCFHWAGNENEIKQNLLFADIFYKYRRTLFSHCRGNRYAHWAWFKAHLKRNGVFLLN